MIANNDSTKSKPYPLTWRVRGVTLIELAFVIVIIATLMLVAVRFYKQQHQDALIKQTAVEMQQIAQAAQAYYVADTNNYWPTSIASLNGVKSCGPLFLNQGGTCGGFNSYNLSFPAGYVAQSTLSGKAASTPLPYCKITELHLDCYCRFIFSKLCACPPGSSSSNCTTRTPKASVITVSTTAPNTQAAEQLANLLPMAKISGTTVSTTLPAPSETPTLSLEEMMNQEQAWIVRSVYSVVIGESNVASKTVSNAEKRLQNKGNNTTVTLPTCPTDWTPGYDVALTSTILQVEGGTNVAMPPRGVYICRKSYSFNPSQAGTTTQFVVKADRKDAGDFYSAVALIITYCVPPKAVANNVFANRYTGYSNVTISNPDSCRFANFTSS